MSVASEVSQEMTLGASLIATLGLPTGPGAPRTLGEMVDALKLDPQAAAAAWCACLASGADHGYCNRRDFAIGLAIYVRSIEAASPTTSRKD